MEADNFFDSGGGRGNFFNTAGARAGRACENNIFSHTGGVGIGSRIFRERILRGKIFANWRAEFRRAECEGGAAGICIRNSGDGERSDIQQTDLGRVLELGSAADDDFRADTDLRRVSDAEGGGFGRTSAGESFGGVFAAERRDGAVSGVHFAANVFFTAPVAGAKFGGQT